MPTPVVRLLDIDFADLPFDRVVELLAGRPADAPFGYVVTPNADHLVRLARSPEMPQLYAAAEMRLLDSRVVARAARLVGLAAPAVVPGSDLTAHLIRNVITPDEPVTIIGLEPQALADLVARTGLRRVSHHNPPMGFERVPEAFDAAVRFVEEHPARFTFLAVGSPRQCMVANAVARRGKASGVGLCIGASLLFLSGQERRAPGLVQRAGMEWAWRLAQDPRRLARRYLIDSPAIITLLRREAQRQRASVQSETP